MNKLTATIEISVETYLNSIQIKHILYSINNIGIDSTMGLENMEIISISVDDNN